MPDATGNPFPPDPPTSQGRNPFPPDSPTQQAKNPFPPDPVTASSGNPFPPDPPAKTANPFQSDDTGVATPANTTLSAPKSGWGEVEQSVGGFLQHPITSTLSGIASVGRNLNDAFLRPVIDPATNQPMRGDPFTAAAGLVGIHEAPVTQAQQRSAALATAGNAAAAALGGTGKALGTVADAAGYGLAGRLAGATLGGTTGGAVAGATNAPEGHRMAGAGAGAILGGLLAPAADEAGGWVKDAAPKLKNVAVEQFSDPYTMIKQQGEGGQAVAQSLTAANARSTLPRYMGIQADRVTAGLTPQQVDQFGKALVASQLDETPNGAAQAAQIRSGLSTDLEQQPWFQQALKRHQTYVEPMAEEGAQAAGVAPETFRRTKLGAYVKLVPETSEPTLPEGQAVVSPQTRPPSTQVSPSAQAASGGASEYNTNYRDLVVRDAADKLKKASVNGVWQSLADHYPPAPDDAAASRVVAISDKGEILDNPAPAPGVRRFLVTPEVKQAVDEFKSGPRQAGPAAKQITSALQVPTELAISNPLVAMWHAARVGANVERATPLGEGLGTARRIGETAVPFGQSAGGLIRAARVDITDPATLADEQHLARIGALRISDATQPDLVGKVPLLGKAHALASNLLQDTDRRLRIVAKQDFDLDRTTKGLPTDGPEYDNSLRSYVTSKLGDPEPLNRGRIFHGPVAQAVSPFAGVHTANIGTDLRGLVGSSGLTNQTLGQRAMQFATGPAGKAAAVGAGAALLSGHTPTGPGYDLPVYKDQDGKLHIFRGSVEEARAKFGPVKELSTRDLAQGPVSAALTKTALSRPADMGWEALRNAENLGFGYLGPAAQAGVIATTGHEPYITPQGDLASAEGQDLTRTARLINRAKATVGAATTSGNLLQSQHPGAGSLLPLTTERSVGGQAGRTVRDVQQYLHTEAIPNIMRSSSSLDAAKAMRSALEEIRQTVPESSTAYRQAERDLLRAQAMHAASGLGRRQAMDRRANAILQPQAP
jgi:hypothetical protein